MSSLDLKNKNFLVFGVANKKSVAASICNALIQSGATVYISAENEKNGESAKKLFKDSSVYVCNVENENEIKDLALKFEGKKLDGIVHSIAFANFLIPPRPFHETETADFLRSANISCFSLVRIANHFKNILTNNASIVTISISSTRVTTYGYLGPIKAALDATVAYLAKSFSSFSEIRFNSVNAGPLKTSASAGIPNYMENYLFAENLIPRKKGLTTEEVANTALFLLSPLSSGINASNLIVDAGMSCNYFDEKVVKMTSEALLKND